MPLLTMILLGASIYLVAMSIKMKSTGEVVENLVNKKVNLDRARDKAGFINYLALRGIIAGVVCTLCSAVMVIDDFYTVNIFVTLFSEVLYFAGLVYYGAASVKAQKKFLI